MPITIKEIIASDTISQLVDKTNFNFDQLMLNGGGPAGPSGPAGPTGPAGGRGPKGTRWYEDTSTSAPGANPNTTPPTSNPLLGDYYLQFNGQVWEYTGNTWEITTIDLQGPQGPQGVGGGFGLSYGSPAIGLETVKYQGPIGLGNGATTGSGGNEGVPTIMVGGAVSTTPPLDATIPLTNAYIIPDSIAQSTISTTVSLFVHQKDTTANAILFHGGAADPADKFEQTDIGALSGIKIGTDDKLILTSPKSATTAISQGDLTGLELSTPQRSILGYAGKSINFTSGNESTAAFGGENSDIALTVGTGSNNNGNKFILTTAGLTNSTVIQAGGGFPVNTAQNANVGVIQLEAGLINMTSSANENIQLNSGGLIKLDTTLGSTTAGQVQLKSASGGILLTSKDGNISIIQSDTSPAATGDVLITNASTAPNSTVGGDIYIKGNSQIILRKETDTAIGSSSIVIDYGYDSGGGVLLPHTRNVGYTTWAPSGLGSGVQPPNSSVYKFNSLSGVLTTSNRVYQRTGSSTLTDYAPGATMEQWIGGLQATSGKNAGLIRIGLGNESSDNPVPITGYSPTMDASLGLSVRSFNEYEEYFSTNIQKTAISNTFVLKRVNQTNSDDNNDPRYTSKQDSALNELPYKWGWDLRYTVPDAATTGTTASSPGLPTTADLNVPIFFLSFGYGVGGDEQGTGTALTENPGYSGVWNFPTGAYPGQRITVFIRNIATEWTTPPKTPSGAATTHAWYGSVQIRIPRFRQKVDSSRPFSSWWRQSTNVATTQHGTHNFTLGTTATDANRGIVRYLALDMIWDGTRSIQTGKNMDGFADDNADSTVFEAGWVIVGYQQRDQGAVSGPQT